MCGWQYSVTEYRKTNGESSYLSFAGLLVHSARHSPFEQSLCKWNVSVCCYRHETEFALVGYILETLSSIRSWQECFKKCLMNCQCLSFNFNEINTTENCELNDANTKLTPAEVLREKEGVDYYEPVRNYYDKNVRKLLYFLSF